MKAEDQAERVLKRISALPKSSNAKALDAMVALIVMEIRQARLEQRDTDAMLADRFHKPDTKTEHFMSCCANEIATSIRSQEIV